jgi:DNA-binding NtrC family response regulator
MQHQADNLALWLQKGLGRGNKRSDVHNSLQITQRNCNVVKETDSDDLNTASQASRHPQANFIDEKFKVRLIARRISRQWETEQLGISHRHRSVYEDTKTEGELKWRTQMKDAQSTWLHSYKN